MNELNLTFLLDGPDELQPYWTMWEDLPYGIVGDDVGKNTIEISFYSHVQMHIHLTKYLNGDPPKLIVQLSNRYHNFPLEAVPIKPPVKKPELVQIWNDFINMFRVPEREEIHDLTGYDS